MKNGEECGMSTGGTVEADWQLNDICNMQCHYCFSTRSGTRASRSVLDPRRCLDFFDGTESTWSLHMTGGEPFLSPGFIDLCKILSRRHLLSINTNLSSTRISEFSHAVDPTRVEYVHCCLHIEERERLNGWKTLENNLTILVRRGFVLFASQIMTPGVFAVFPESARRLLDLGVGLIPKSLQGPLNGKWYPHAYSEKEKDLFRVFSEQAETHLRINTPALVDGVFSVNPLRDREFLDGFPKFRNIPCAAGKRFFTIQSNGNIHRCGTNQLLGNIQKDIFGPLPTSAACNSSYYPYFCLRYSQLQQNVSIRLEEPPSPSSQTIHSLVRKAKRIVRHVLT